MPVQRRARHFAGVSAMTAAPHVAIHAGDSACTAGVVVVLVVVAVDVGFMRGGIVVFDARVLRP